MSLNPDPGDTGNMVPPAAIRHKQTLEALTKISNALESGNQKCAHSLRQEAEIEKLKEAHEEIKDQMRGLVELHKQTNESVCKVTDKLSMFVRAQEISSAIQADREKAAHEANERNKQRFAFTQGVVGLLISVLTFVFTWLVFHK